MLYILAQRLKAQSVQGDKTSKVINDIAGAVFSEKLVKELFKPQEMYTRRYVNGLRLNHPDRSISIIRTEVSE